MSLIVENVDKDVDEVAHLQGINLTLKRGAFNVLLGPTLSGKTSLLRLLSGLDSPSGGKIILDGQDIGSVPVWKRGVSMVYQQFINYPHLNIFENIAFPLRRARMAKADIKAKVHEVAEMLHIDSFLDRMPGELSGGQQQRTALARSLVKDAGLLLLDEPLLNLDYKLREELRDEFMNIFAKKQDTIIVYSTTEPFEALMLGGNICILDEGRQLQTGLTHEVYRNPCCEAVARIFNDPPMNMIDGIVSDGAIVLGDGLQLPLPSHLSALADGPYNFGIRAAHLSLTRANAKETGFDAVVELAEVSGSETFIHARHNGVLWVVQEEGVHGHSMGQTFPVFFDPAYLFAFDKQGWLAAAPVPTDSPL